MEVEKRVRGVGGVRESEGGREREGESGERREMRVDDRSRMGEGGVGRKGERGGERRTNRGEKWVYLLLPIHVIIYGGTSHGFSVHVKHIYDNDGVGMEMGVGSRWGWDGGLGWG